MVHDRPPPTPIGYYAAKEAPSPTDWRIGSTTLQKIADAPNSFWTKQIQYNQNEVHYFSCTIFAAVGAVSDLTGYRFTKTQLTKMVQEARQFGFSEDGWYVNAAVDFVRNWWKQNQSPNFTSYLIEMDSSNLLNVLAKGYSVVTGFRHTPLYQSDIDTDGVLDTTNLGEFTGGGHAIRMAKDNQDPTVIRAVVDNYINVNPHNIYRIKATDLKTLVQKGVFFSDGYIFANTVPTMFKDIPDTQQTDWYRSAAEWAAKRGLMGGFNDGTFRPNEPITRAQMAIILKKMYDELDPKTPPPNP
jgi:hypothetical protein